MNREERSLDASQREHISQISTRWSLVARAHGENDQVARAARRALVQRYLGAVYRYALALTRDELVAEDLAQDLLLKFLDGELHRAAPERGRFRDYVKTILINLVRKQLAAQARAPGTLPEQLADPRRTEGQEEAEFDRQWRAEVLRITWATLHERNPVYHDVLRLRLDHPDLSSTDLADLYGQTAGRSMTAAHVRKTLQRAHVLFADLLVGEVAAMLADPSPDSVTAELAALDLLKYSRAALDRWTSKYGRQ